MKKRNLEYVPLWKILPQEELEEFQNFLADLEKNPFESQKDFDCCFLSRDNLKSLYKVFLEEESQEDTIGFLGTLDKLERGVFIEFSFQLGPRLINDLEGLAGKTIKDARKFLLLLCDEEYVRIDFTDNTYCVIEPSYDGCSDLCGIDLMGNEDEIEALREDKR